MRQTVMMSDIPRTWPCFLSPHVAKIAFENGFAERDSSRGGRSFCPLSTSATAVKLGAPETTEITLCITFGDLHLATQFFQSLSESAQENVDLHLVACCFQVLPHEIESLLEKHPSLLKSHKTLPESWGTTKEDTVRWGPGMWRNPIDVAFRGGVVFFIVQLRFFHLRKRCGFWTMMSCFPKHPSRMQYTNLML